jgi:Phage integrase, N-terminal SAM-like domain
VVEAGVLDIIRPPEESFYSEAMAPVVQVDGDEQLLALWLHGRSERTQRAFRTDAGSFLSFVSKPLRTVTVGDVQDWMDTLDRLAPASQARKISSLKSLFGFGHRLGYLPFDVGRVVKRPKLKVTLVERILSEGDVHRMFVTADQPTTSGRTPLQKKRVRQITCCCVCCTPLPCASTRSPAWSGVIGSSC